MKLYPFLLNFNPFEAQENAISHSNLTIIFSFITSNEILKQPPSIF